MSEDADLAAVEEFGPYLVYERLGVGGMATVHRALERGIEGFERIVALKRLLPHLAEDASFIKSFVREAKLASTLTHPNIVQTLELGRVGGSYFISMEYIDGRDVRKILRHARKVSGPPPINVTLALMLQLCDALDYAHNRTDTDGNPLGIVHRDLSPSNLLMTRNGHLKVIDFGIAKAQAAHLATQTGRVKGKLAYMAPESIAGKELDARSDLFAAGVVFHELLTARPLFAQKNEYQTLLKVQRGDVAPPSTFNEGVPKELDDIVLKALAKEPDDRWTNAAALRDALVTVRMARQLSATPRDVQTWCEWAFSLDIGGFSGKTGTEAFSSGMVSGPTFGTVSPIARKTPIPRPVRAPTPSAPHMQAQHADEEAAVEIAWGAAEIDQGVPHLHDDVPDVSGKLSAVMMSAGDSGLSEANTDQHGFDPAAMAAAGATQPEMQASTIKTLAVPPPNGRSEIRPAAFPNGTDDDPLVRARPRTTSRQPTVLPQGTRPPATTPTLRGQRAPSQPPMTTSAARGSTMNLLGGLDSADGPPPVPEAMLRPRTATPGPAIGASIAARPTNGKRNLIIALAVLVVAGAGITLAVVMGGDKDTGKAAAGSPTVEPVAAKTTGTVKFVIDPADASVKLDGGEPHEGTPWQIELPAGIHQVEIHHPGYKSWLTTVELSGAETQTLRVVLEKAAGSESVTATLIVDPSMPGLEVTLDDKLLDQKTPVKVEIPPGPHKVALRQDGAEVWAEDFTAVSNATHEFDPSMTADKQRERKHRHDHVATNEVRSGANRPESLPYVMRTTPVVPAPVTPTPTPTTTPSTATSTVKTTTPTPPPPPPPSTSTSTTTPSTSTTPPSTSTTPKNGSTTPAITQPKIPAKSSGEPVTIPPTKVSRTSGSVPSLKGSSSLAGEKIPANISAKVCIDSGGSVTSTKVLTKLPEDARSLLERSIKSWRYSPYKDGGAAVPACFVASFRSN